MTRIASPALALRRLAAQRSVSAIIMGLGACGEPHPALRSPEPEVERLGAAVYGRSCAACHGLRGEGAANWKVPIAPGVYPPPPHDSTGHTWHHADGLLFRVVANGGGQRPVDHSPARPTGMPAFRDSLSDAEIRAVLIYVKRLWTDEQRIGQWTASRADSFPAPR
jgi:mono/diheme cytochrome c family protein